MIHTSLSKLRGRKLLAPKNFPPSVVQNHSLEGGLGLLGCRLDAKGDHPLPLGFGESLEIVKPARRITSPFWSHAEKPQNSHPTDNASVLQAGTTGSVINRVRFLEF